MRVVARLREGHIRELKGAPPAGIAATRASVDGLEALLGFGRRFFDPRFHDPPLTRASRPDYLAYLAPGPAPFPALPWAPGEAARGEADLALQLTGPSPAAVNRAAVEVWKAIRHDGLPLRVAASFDGFGRADGRGWLEFHDGVSNIESSRRPAALTAAGEPDWMAGGTYMAFLRMRVDLARWSELDRGEQELVIGRDKLTGSPLVSTRRDAQGRVRPVAAPVPPARPSRAQRAAFAEPPETTDPVLESSHMHRANQNRASTDAPTALRIFRQGYDFLDALGPDGPELGLNFVSFQASLATLQHLLHLPRWLADVNFGGPPEPAPGEPPSPRLLTLRAGGFYAVPPKARPFPGAALFG